MANARLVGALPPLIVLAFLFILFGRFEFREHRKDLSQSESSRLTGSSSLKQNPEVDTLDAKLSKAQKQELIEKTSKYELRIVRPMTDDQFQMYQQGMTSWLESQSRRWTVDQSKAWLQVDPRWRLFAGEWGYNLHLGFDVAESPALEELPSLLSLLSAEADAIDPGPGCPALQVENSWRTCRRVNWISTYLTFARTTQQSAGSTGTDLSHHFVRRLMAG
jgi:hypothetical protein